MRRMKLKWIIQVNWEQDLLTLILSGSSKLPTDIQDTPENHSICLLMKVLIAFVVDLLFMSYLKADPSPQTPLGPQ